MPGNPHKIRAFRAPIPKTIEPPNDNKNARTDAVCYHLVIIPTRTEFLKSTISAVRSLFYATSRYHFVIIRTLEQSSTINHLQLPTHRFLAFFVIILYYSDTRIALAQGGYYV